MHPSKFHNNTPASDDRVQDDPWTDLAEQLEAIKTAMAEAEDIAAEFAIEAYLEAKRLSK